MSNFKIIYISNMNFMLITGCAEYLYSFMKAVRFTHMNLKETTKYRIIYNHCRKIAKIGNGWRNFIITKFSY